MLRYVLTANAPENKDNDFTWRDFQARNDNELVAIYETLSIELLCSHISTMKEWFLHQITTPKWTKKPLRSCVRLPIQIATAVENYRFREASQILLKIARLGNKYLADEEPWKQQKPIQSVLKPSCIMAYKLQQYWQLLALHFTTNRQQTKPYWDFATIELE